MRFAVPLFRAALVFSAAALSQAAAEPSVDRVEAGNLVYENIPAIPDALTARLQQYQNTRSAHLEDWTPQGGLLISTRFGETSQLHTVAEPMGARRQITFFGEPLANGEYAPDANRFLFTKDIGGNETYQIYVFDAAAGRATQLTAGDSRNESYVWTSAGDRFAFRSNRRNMRDWDIYLMAPEAGAEPQMVYEGEGFWLPGDFTPDDTKLALLKYVSITDTTLKILDLESGEETLIDPADGKEFTVPVEFSADGETLYLVSDAGSEYRTLRAYDLASGAMTELTGDLGWNVEEADLSPDGSQLAYVVNEDGLSKLEIRAVDGWTERPVPDLPPGLVNDLKFSPDGDKLAFTFERATNPDDVFVWDLASQTLTQWTASEVGGLDTAGFAAPELIRYESFDGLEIPAFVYTPAGEGPHPVVVLIHGGPEGQYRPGYSPTVQYLVNEMGVALVAPNVRGSSGYGKTYVGLDNGRKREDSVKDIGALIGWIAAEPGLDAGRIVPYGGSYGGYMVLASLVHYSDRLKGGIDVVGISNFVTFLENTKDYRKAVRRPEYGDERDPEMRAFLERISPLNNAEAIDAPLFVIQGLNDPRVPVTESEQIVTKVRQGGAEVWYLLAKDEGHGFRKKSNRDFQMAAVMLFLDRLFFAEGEG